MELLHHVVGVEPVVGHQEALEAGHVAVLAVPGDQHGAGGHVPDVEAADGGQRTQLRVLRGHEVPVTQPFWLVALGANFPARPDVVNPLSVLREPQLLVKTVTGANNGVTYNRQYYNQLATSCHESLMCILSIF